MNLPSLSWLDLTATDRDKVHRVLELFREQGTVDELGLGSLRDALSNALFPGTSVLHTRMRYALFIPWIYQRIESWGGGYDIAHEARRLEVELIDALSESDDTAGIIGKEARATLAQLPSTAYWAMLTHWGLFIPGRPKGWYHTHFDGLLQTRSGTPRADDPGVVWERKRNWHARLPAPPSDFPERASFALTAEEGDFLRGRIESTCTGSLLAWLAREGTSSLAGSLWDEPAARRAGGTITETFELARRFSLHVEGAPLLYNLILAERRHARQPCAGDQKLIDGYRMDLTQWAQREGDEEPFDTADLWSFVVMRGGRPRLGQQQFVDGWAARIRAVGAARIVDDRETRHRLIAREQQLKGPRARTLNQGRLLDWSGRVGVGRMDFRWPNVRQLLMDLHTGLGR